MGSASYASAALVATPPPLLLRKFDLNFSQFTAAGVVSVAHALGRCFSGDGLRGIDLRSNPKLGDAGISALAKALPASLQRLTIEVTGCGDEGILTVVAVLPRLLQLQGLDCGGNSIGIAGWTALGRALPVLPALGWFSACDCAGMGDAGIAAPVAELPRCALFGDLWLERCGIGATGTVALAVLSMCLELRNLEITGNGLGPEGATPLRRAARPELTIEWTEGRDHVPLW